MPLNQFEPLAKRNTILFTNLSFVKRIIISLRAFLGVFWSRICPLFLEHKKWTNYVQKSSRVYQFQMKYGRGFGHAHRAANAARAAKFNLRKELVGTRAPFQGQNLRKELVGTRDARKRGQIKTFSPPPLLTHQMALRFARRASSTM